MKLEFAAEIFSGFGLSPDFLRTTFQPMREIHALMREIHAFLDRHEKSFCIFAGIFKETAVGISSAKEIFRNPVDSLHDSARVRQLSPDENKNNNLLINV